mgnify:FL=1
MFLENERPTLDKIHIHRRSRGENEQLPEGSLLFAMYPELKVSGFVTNEVFKRHTSRYIPIGSLNDTVIRERTTEANESSSTSKKRKLC